MTVTVRPARSQDRQVCLDLIQTLNGNPATAAWGATFDALITQERGSVLVADDIVDGVLGIATVSYNLAIRFGGEYAQLEELFVDPRARGKNVGELLVQAVVAAARERGCTEIGIHILHKYSANRSFYARYGFVHTGEEVRQRLD